MIDEEEPVREFEVTADGRKSVLFAEDRGGLSNSKLFEEDLTEFCRGILERLEGIVSPEEPSLSPSGIGYCFDEKV